MSNASRGASVDRAGAGADRHGRSEIARRVRALGEWFHNLDLGGVATAPDHPLGDFPRLVWKHVAPLLPVDLRGKSVLDIGCNAGFYSLELKRRGAARVLGIDPDERYLAQARFAAEVHGLEIDYRQMSVYEVPQLQERFDLVLFMGVLYHLRHPLLALDLIHEHVVADRLLFQSMQRGATEIAAVEPDYPFAERQVFEQPGFPRMSFIEHSYAGDPTNWWVPNRACAEAMLRSAGFVIEQHVASEFYLCRRGQRSW
jgi:tRNA (mo5U34)-methyltransferase